MSGFSRTMLLLVLATTAALSARERCEGCLWARYWTIPSSPGDCSSGATPCFPESDALQGRPSLGIAFSGGGTRSATMSLGQLRGLQQLHILDKVTYISAVSGGSWAAVPFVYSKQTVDEILGRYDEPKALVRDTVIKDANGTLARAIADSSLAAGSVQEVLGDVAAFSARQFGARVLQSVVASLNGLKRREPDRLNKTYARLLGERFIDPLVEPGRGASGRLFSWDTESMREIAQRTGGAVPQDLVVAGTNRPFLIANGTIIVARADADYPLLIPIEYTPLYVGVRQRFGNRFGGIYVSPWAYDAVQIGDVNRADHLVQVKFDPSRRFTLADVVASSGAAPQLPLIIGDFVPSALRDRIQQASGTFPAFRHLAVSGDPAATRQFVTDEVAHGDGGFSENLGVMPLLARGVKNLIVFNNTNTEYVEANDDMKALFFPAGPRGRSGDKTVNTVFWCSPAKETCDEHDRDSSYHEIVRELVARREAHRPQVYCSRGLKVRGNARYGVAPNTAGVNVCWFYNSIADEWENAQPWIHQMIRGLDKSDAGKGFDGFPWIGTFFQNKPHVIQLKTQQVNLLSNLTAWIVVHEADTMAQGLSY